MSLELPLGKPFREEMLASGMVLILVMTASFYTVSRVIKPDKSAPSSPQIETKEIVPTTGKVLGETAIVPPTVVPETENLEPSPTIDPNLSEVIYGTGGKYDYENYTLKLINPRLEVSLKEPGKRKFMVDLFLENKTVAEGIEAVVYASIIKDGDIIVPKAVLSTPEKVNVKMGEKITTKAQLSLIEATDVKEILFTPPPDLPQIVHPLKKTRVNGDE